MENQSKIEYEKLTVGYEFAPSSFGLDNKQVALYLGAVEDNNGIYDEQKIVPPMAVAARAMTAMSSGLVLPDGAVHVSQDLEFKDTVKTGEILTCFTRVNRKVERGKFHMLNIGINVINHNKTTVLSGETSFILALPAVEKK